MMEIARNPSRLQEMTRTMDRQMQNLEAMPGGMNILQRMYRDVQVSKMTAQGIGIYNALNFHLRIISSINL